ncbi:ABC transporter permease [Rhizobium sp. BE258]|uniref:ABC transporter permease n=1 Tax=Rhizobium sp. BE258 TaxID=2817722 RepID=UPI002858B2C7|nr:ABC transporter permease [Rhizobium sp. BE258]MDR7145001.1 peptide/nickel transport system permease protein [Rhizobium sp. BE258]
MDKDRRFKFWRWPGSLQLGAALLVAEMLIAGSASTLYPGDPFDMVGMPFVRPWEDPQFPLGTNILGRDIAAQLIHGTRVSLLIGLAATLIATFVGGSVGLVAGYFGGWIDHLLMRFTELFQVIPHFLLAIIIVSILGPHLPNIILSIGVTSWSMVARMVRADALKLRELDFVKIAVVLGGGHSRAIIYHVLPNAIGPVLVAGSILSSLAVLSEAGLAFLGLSDSNYVSWGGMMGANRDALLTAPFMTLIPGAAIVLTVASLSMIGDGMVKLLARRGGV